MFVGSDEPGTRTTTSAADFVNATNTFSSHQQYHHHHGHGGEEFWMEQPFDMSQLGYSAEGNETEFAFNPQHALHQYQHHQQYYGQPFDRQSPQEHLQFADLSVSR